MFQKSLSKKTFMRLAVFVIMITILTFWVFCLRNYFSKTKSEPKESIELKKLQQEFGQIFSGFKKNKWEKIFNTAPTLRPDSQKTKELGEEEIEELRKKIFEELPISPSLPSG